MDIDIARSNDFSPFVTRRRRSPRRPYTRLCVLGNNTPRVSIESIGDDRNVGNEQFGPREAVRIGFDCEITGIDEGDLVDVGADGTADGRGRVEQRYGNNDAGVRAIAVRIREGIGPRQQIDVATGRFDAGPARDVGADVADDIRIGAEGIQRNTRHSPIIRIVRIRGSRR